jgi:hypothetical protein
MNSVSVHFLASDAFATAEFYLDVLGFVRYG